MAVNEIVEKLRLEETRLKQQVEKLRAQFAKYESELTQVQAALVALGEKPKPKAAGKPMRTRASKREIIAAISEVLGQHGVVETGRLKAAVEKSLDDRGRSRQGFSVCFNESLEDARFVETPGGWRLAAEHEADTHSDGGNEPMEVGQADEQTEQSEYVDHHESAAAMVE
jgi:hypothetical protein